MIEDGYVAKDEEPKYTPYVNRLKYEQSDMIMVLLNLGYVPDEVVQSMTDFKPGWSLAFKSNMEDYWAKFNLNNDEFIKRLDGGELLSEIPLKERYDQRWAFQDENDLEDRYVKFI